MKIDPNAPAFPFPSGPEPRINTYHDRAEGLTIRAHFAAMAMQGILASNTTVIPTVVANEAVWYADALISELNAQPRPLP